MPTRKGPSSVSNPRATRPVPSIGWAAGTACCSERASLHRKRASQAPYASGRSILRLHEPRQHAAVDDELATGDERGGVRNEEGDGGRDLARVGNPGDLVVVEGKA